MRASGLVAIGILGLGGIPLASAPGSGPFVRDLGRGDVAWIEGRGADAPQGAVQVGSDPHLEGGFPVQLPHTAGTYHAGPALHVLVAEIDGDPELEIVRTALATGPLHAWNHDGSPVVGWPASTSGAAYPAWGRVQPRGPASKRRNAVFSGDFSGRLVLWRADAAPWAPGWPLQAANYVASPPTLADLDGDEADEILLEEEDGRLHAYRGDGTVVPGWPVWDSLSGQERHTPAVADLDGAGGPEVITVGSWVTGGAYLFAYHADGSPVGGFPVVVPTAFVDTFPAVGDVDGDGDPEIVIVSRHTLQLAAVNVFSYAGALERTIALTDDVPYGTAPALADLDGNGVPDIVVQTDTTLEVVRGDGSGALPGWPKSLGSGLRLGDSAPVIGDVTGDGEVDIAVTTQMAGSAANGHVRLYHKTGAVVAGFPKTLPLGSGMLPAIADIDRDGRNELVVGGSYWNGVSGTYDALWAYDLHGVGYGPVPWGQFMGGPKHQGRYVAP